uniref:Uncharacterized protein n=1 Tax=Arundo donax TaxID=35708 RepID=A0A0A9BYM4_ARUDO
MGAKHFRRPSCRFRFILGGVAEPIHVHGRGGQAAVARRWRTSRTAPRPPTVSFFLLLKENGVIRIQ